MSLDGSLDKEYETRVTAFVDILGFRSLVGKSQGNRSLVPQLVRALEAYRDGYPVWKALPQAEARQEPVDKLKSIRSHTFSDSILISGETSASSIDSIVKGVCYVTANLLGMGQLSRGGIEVGDLYHDDRIAFGPALIDAYDLESKAAVYPRIVLSEAFIDLAKEHEVARYFRRDSDGQYYLDVLSWQIDSDPHDHGWLPLAQQWMESLRSSTKERLNSTEHAWVRCKTVWFAGYFNDVVSLHSELNVSKLDIV